MVGLVPALDDGIEAEGAALAGSAARSVTATTMALRKSVAADCCSGWTAGLLDLASLSISSVRADLARTRLRQAPTGGKYGGFDLTAARRWLCEVMMFAFGSCGLIS